MFRTLWQTWTPRRGKPERTGRLPSKRPNLECLEDRCLLTGTVTISSFTVPQATEGLLSNPSISATFVDTSAVAVSQLTATIDYGDGTALSTGSITQKGTNYTVTDSHTFPEESGSTVPPFAFNATLHVFENANPTTDTDTSVQQALVLDAALSPGNPVTPGTTVAFAGGNTGNPTSAAGALANFKSAIGGSKNTLPAPQNGGFRTITWDGVKVDGTDAAAGPNSTTVITPGHTVGIPLNRFQGQGVFFGAIYAVSNDGFVDVNPNVGSPNPVLFSAFSAPNTFAMFNDNGIDFKFVAPGSPFAPPVSAVSRGFGAIFLNVQQPGTTIQYFHGSTLLDTFNVPTNSTAGAAIFAGELFSNPVVTNVLLTLGQGVIFKFDGTTVTSGGVNSAANNLVATDDFVYPEPVPTANGFPIVSGAQGTTNAPIAVSATLNVPFAGVVATFSDADPSGNAKDYTATINWGDGHFSNGTLAKNASGGFDVSGTNTYTVPGVFPINVEILDFGGGPGAGGSQPTLSVNNTAGVSAGDQNFRFVAQVYLDLLGRKVDPSGLAFWGGSLDAGILTRGQVVTGIETSLEYRIVEVTQAYEQLLNRTPDPVGLNAFVQFLIGGGKLEQMKAAIAGSGEFFNLSQTLSHPAGVTTANEKFVDSLFQKILGRSADPSGLSFFSQELNNNVQTPVVALQVLASPEAETDLVQSFYPAFLRRQADSGGLTAFTDQLLAGVTDEQVIASIVASGEYFGNV